MKIEQFIIGNKYKPEPPGLLPYQADLTLTRTSLFWNEVMYSDHYYYVAYLSAVEADIISNSELVHAYELIWYFYYCRSLI